MFLVVCALFCPVRGKTPMLRWNDLKIEWHVEDEEKLGMSSVISLLFVQLPLSSQLSCCRKKSSIPVYPAGQVSSTAWRNSDTCLCGLFSESWHIPAQPLLCNFGDVLWELPLFWKHVIMVLSSHLFVRSVASGPPQAIRTIMWVSFSNDVMLKV